MFGNNTQGYGYQQTQHQGGYQQPQQQSGATLGSLDDLLTGSGAKSFFTGDSQPGATVTGVIDVIEVSQVRDYQTQQPAYWNDGKPKEQIHIVIQTQLRDPSVDDDDGRRSLWIKGWGVQLKAFREACKKAGIKSPAKGDTITATFTGYGEKGTNPQPPKVYQYEIHHENGVDRMLGQQPQQQSTYQQTPQATSMPASQQQTQPATQVSVTQLQQLQAAGKNVQEIAGMTGLSENQVNQALQPQTGSEEEPMF